MVSDKKMQHSFQRLPESKCGTLLQEVRNRCAIIEKRNKKKTQLTSQVALSREVREVAVSVKVPSAKNFFVTSKQHSPFLSPR